MARGIQPTPQQLADERHITPARIDWLRAGVWFAVLSGSLAAWILGVTWLATRWN